ncbi:unnamed protein product [Nesidiocoris tenuis]|uniref:Coiled-coil domain-containing protein 43 n=2 Tax=Nesidiocoris tenuis TaxID=355587 RepID=A0A6H5G4Z5_9HEMI|nr:Coiled-coil domain-containing protein [Nesidiocoris tenuis]CAA9997621.1 unnamed protein product [Nesidiocoris tenuis]CAB0017534.1 unnamed protein product [Nesidiocoris tenuis]
MATSLESNFDDWLSLKLKSLNTDEGVFGNYITGILTGDESLEEKTEALEGILSEIIEDDINAHCREILDKWSESFKVVQEEQKKPEEDVEEKLVRLMETNTLTTTVQREYTDEERKIRQAILSQYGEVQTSDTEFDDGETADDGAEKSLHKNTNVSSVIQAEKEKREKAKTDSQKKKDKDREDRERQKQQQADKKEKRKTQKGERRR